MVVGMNPEWLHSIPDWQKRIGKDGASKLLDADPFRQEWIIRGVVVNRAEMRAFERRKWGIK